MTKDEMLKECFADNYAIIQRQIKDAMKKGEKIEEILSNLHNGRLPLALRRKNAYTGVIHRRRC